MERWKTHTKVDLKKEVVERLIKMKNVGDSYSDVIERLLNGNTSA